MKQRCSETLSSLTSLIMCSGRVRADPVERVFSRGSCWSQTGSESGSGTGSQSGSGSGSGPWAGAGAGSGSWCWSGMASTWCLLASCISPAQLQPLYRALRVAGCLLDWTGLLLVREDWKGY